MSDHTIMIIRVVLIFFVQVSVSCLVVSNSLKSHGGRSLVGYSPWGHKESDMTERLHFHFLSGSKEGKWEEDTTGGGD